jgi:hypothetical protein
VTEGSTVETIDRPRAQRLDALARANDVRTAKKTIKEAIAAAGPDRRLTARAMLGEAGAFGDAGAHLDALYLAELLLATPGIGKSKMRLLLLGVLGSHTAGPERIRLGSLTPRQRGLIATRLLASSRPRWRDVATIGADPCPTS